MAGGEFGKALKRQSVVSKSRIKEKVLKRTIQHEEKRRESSTVKRRNLRNGGKTESGAVGKLSCRGRVKRRGRGVDSKRNDVRLRLELGVSWKIKARERAEEIGRSAPRSPEKKGIGEGKKVFPRSTEWIKNIKGDTTFREERCCFRTVLDRATKRSNGDKKKKVRKRTRVRLRREGDQISLNQGGHEKKSPGGARGQKKKLGLPKRQIEELLKKPEVCKNEVMLDKKKLHLSHKQSRK